MYGYYYIFIINAHQIWRSYYPDWQMLYDTHLAFQQLAKCF